MDFLCVLVAIDTIAQSLSDEIAVDYTIIRICRTRRWPAWMRALRVSEHAHHWIGTFIGWRLFVATEMLEKSSIALEHLPTETERGIAGTMALTT